MTVAWPGSALKASAWIAALGAALTLLSGGCLAPSSFSSLESLEKKVLFQPSRYPAGAWAPKDLVFEDAWFNAEDDVRLHGWYCPVERPRAVVLYAHGNAGNITSRYWKLRLLTEKLGVSVLVFDYRGYGKSEGAPSEAGILADGRAARRWLAQRTGLPETDIVLLGESLGGAVAVDLAAEQGARALILESTFSSIPDVAASKLSSGGSLVRSQLDSASKIGRYHGPLLQTHGDADKVIPFALGKKLHEAANAPKQFVRVPGGGHNGPPSREYLAALDRFLASLPR